MVDWYIKFHADNSEPKATRERRLGIQKRKKKKFKYIQNFNFEFFFQNTLRKIQDKFNLYNLENVLLSKFS